MDHNVHHHPDHVHSPSCGHTAIWHNDHLDYLHDGCLHHPHEDHFDEHVLEVSDKNPAQCDGGHHCTGHEADHQHGPGCGHEAIPHGDHVDYLVGDHLHHFHNGHCDDHGKVDRV